MKGSMQKDSMQKYLNGGKEERTKRLKNLENELEKTNQRLNNLQSKYADKRINEALRLMLLIDKGSNKNKKGQTLVNMGLSGKVEIIGVEPTTSCMPCKRSSQLSYIPD